MSVRGLILAYLFDTPSGFASPLGQQSSLCGPANSTLWSVLVWTLLSPFHQPVAGLLQYSAAELLQLRVHLPEPPLAALHLHRDIALLPHRRYIHRGSRWNFNIDSSKAIQSLWSTTHRPPKNTGRVADHYVLASVTRSATSTLKHDNTAVNFSLLNIRSLSSKGHLIQDLLTERKFDFLCLTETWQQTNDFSQLNDSTPLGFVYISQPRGSVVVSR